LQGRNNENFVFWVAAQTIAKAGRHGGNGAAEARTEEFGGR
jgi:hypothetical protein